MIDHSQEPTATLPDPLGEMIQSRAWARASEEVSRRLALAQTAAKRTFYYLFLANLSKRMIIESRRKREYEALLGHLADAEAFLESAVRESPQDVSARNTFAEFHIKHRRDPTAALRFLDPIHEADEAPRGDLEWQDHRRIALRGAALALTGETDDALRHLNEAYGPRFQASLPSAYKNALWFISLGGIRLEEDFVNGILAELRKFKMLNERNLIKLHAALIEEA